MDPQENDKVARLLGSLKRVDAPANFEKRVRARISEAGRPERDGRPVFWKPTLSSLRSCAKAGAPAIVAAATMAAVNRRRVSFIEFPSLRADASPLCLMREG